VQRLVEAGFFLERAHPDRRHPVDQPEHGVREPEGPYRREQDRGALLHEKLGVAREEAVGARRVEGFGCEEAQQHDPQRAPYAVHAPDIQRVIEANPVLERHGVVAHHTGDRPDERGGCGGDVAGRGRHRGQPGHRARQQAHELGFSGQHPVQPEPHDGREGCREIRIEERHRRRPVHAELAARVEAVPPEPEESRSQRDERDAVRLGAGFAPPAHVEHRRQRRHSGDVVHHDPAGEIQDAPLLEDAAAPDHVHEGEVDEQEPARQKQHVGLERDAVREGSGDERRSDDREHHLVGAEHDQGNRIVGRGRVQVHMTQESHVHVADDRARAAEAHRESTQPPQHRGPTQGHEALHHDRQDILPAHQPAVEESQAGRHEHDQAAAQQHEPGIAGIEMQHGNPSCC
jgi:hypothetical protein